jgi:outer membrane lipoprotein SlyB
MRQLILAIATIITVATIAPAARADMVGAAAGAGSGLLVAGPVGAVAGGVMAVFPAIRFGGRQ